MVIVDTTFSKLCKNIKKKITIEELEVVLADIGMELDSVDGDNLRIEITAERTDLVTPEGLARAINCYKGFTKKYEEIKVNVSEYVHNVDPEVKKYRPFTRSFVIKGISLIDEDIKSLMTIQEKLHETYGRKRKKIAIGIYDLDKIKFPILYSVKKPKEIRFVPLGMIRELDGLQILQQHPTGKNYAHLLDNFDKYPVQIDAKNQVLSLPPIINSDDLGKISIDTKNIFVEMTGVDEDALDKTCAILATMFYDLGGKVYSVTIKDGKKSVRCPDLIVRKKSVSLKFINNLIGLNLTLKDVSQLLPKMEYNVIKTQGDLITVEIPFIRTDIWHNVDIADDVARAFGYNNIKPTLPNIDVVGEMLPMSILIEDVCNFLTGFDFLEVKTFALTNNEEQYQKMNVEEENHIKLGKNTQDKNLNMIRTWLIPECIKALVANRNREYPQKIFECGIVVEPDQKLDVKSKNVHKLTCLICDKKADFTRIKQILDAIANYLDLKLEIEEIDFGCFIKGRCGSIILDKKEIGIIGEIHPKVLENWGLDMPVVALELNIKEIIKK